MSEAESSAGREIWIEKYRPQTLDDVHGQEDIVERLRSYIERDDLPHLLFAGPAGVGKCVTGDTPVLTNRGVERIDRVVGDVDGFAEPDADLRIPTLGPDGTFDYVAPSHVFGKETDDLVEVETRDGGTTTATPEHKLLVLTGEGFVWKRAADLECGDRLARPLSIPMPGVSDLDWLSRLDDERIEIQISNSFASANGIDTAVSPAQLRALDVDIGALREGVERLQYVNASGNRSPSITPVWDVTPELARFIGLSVAEARLDGGRIKFYNTDEGLLDAFERAATGLFDVETTRGVQHDVQYVEIGSRTLTRFLELTFDVFASGTGADSEVIGSTLVTAPEPARTAFLRAMFDAEAHVTEHGIIELSQKDEAHITLLSYLLASIGIPSRRKSKRKAATNGTGVEREYHTLYISGASALRRFRDCVGFSLESKAARLDERAAKKSNPNHDTIPAQAAARDLCRALNLPIGELLSDTLNPDSPGRDAYLADIRSVLAAATERIETVQEVLERIQRLQPALTAASGLPATWTANRETLAPIETRRDVSDATGIRSDRLLEYADGRRTPTAHRTGELLVELDAVNTPPEVATVRETLRECIDALGVSYNEVAEGTGLRGVGVISLLEREKHDLASFTRFETIARRVQSLAGDMLSLDVVEALDELDTVASAQLYYDEVTSVERLRDERRVYDLTVPGTRNYVAGRVPTVMHNTTCATAIARAVYGDDWRGNFLELNASDERGIDVVRDRIKNFARSSFGGYDYRIIFLDEADSLTSDAQSALRRTMEQFSDNTRFVLSCNYSSRIIDPIQSRCAVFRFAPLSDEAVAAQIADIADAEGIELTEDGLDALVYAAAGDMRRAINSLQAAATTGEVVDDEAVYTITSTARPEEIEEMVRAAIDGDFTSARGTLETLLVETGMAGGDIIDQLHRSAWDFGLDERETVRLMERIGEADYRITQGANEQVQLEALLASLALKE
ncbi:MAG: replication factor C small subunit [Salinigranum sp.]